MEDKSDNNINKKPVFTEEKGFDGYQFIAMMLSVQTMFFRYKPMLWCSLLFLISSFYVKKKNQDKSQILMVAVMLVFSFYSLYFNDPYKQLNKNSESETPKEEILEDQNIEGEILDN